MEKFGKAWSRAVFLQNEKIIQSGEYNSGVETLLNANGVNALCHEVFHSLMIDWNQSKWLLRISGSLHATCMYEKEK